MYTHVCACVCVCVRRRIRITIAPSLLTTVFPGYLKKKKALEISIPIIRFYVVIISLRRENVKWLPLLNIII